MASAIARRAFSASSRRFAPAAGEEVLKTESKRNPELLILAGVMTVSLGVAGYYFGRSPTKSTSETAVTRAGMPWETGATEGKYRYFPRGDSSAEPKDAPSALNVVIVPNVTLPKELHDKYNKWGKDGY